MGRLRRDGMLDEAIEFSVNKVRKLAEDFVDKFPAEQSCDYTYTALENASWVEGFWTGMLWLSYEFTEDEKLKEIAKGHIDIFKKRIDNRIGVDNHDLGFLYSLSCVSAYKLTGNTVARDAALSAADLLIKRFQEKGEFIQAWGEIGERENYRLIVDCLLNIPLLHWATETTGDNKYRDIAVKHLKTTVSVAIREDFTTYHTYYFDPDTGEKLHGVTHQGYSDDSCWARGQAWGVYGLALGYAYTKDERLISIFNKVTECFLSKLPEDNVPYWDLIFTSGNEPRDTSAAVIAMCGILEMNKHHKNDKFMDMCLKIMKSLCDNYITDERSNGILTDGMYARTRGDNPECNIWGDYFFMEALMRIKNPDWKMYW